MANQLKMAVVHTILTLKQGGWSQRRIARTLGINRETVGRYIHVRRAGPKPASEAPIRSGGSKPAKAPTGSEAAERVEIPAGRSQCEPFAQIIQEKLEKGFSRQRIYQDLRDEHGFAGSYYSVRRFVRRLGQTSPIPFRRMECMPGEEAQVDFGVGAPIMTPEGRRRRTHVLRIVLSFSRRGYSEAVYREDSDGFIRCLENAFWHFDGATRTVIIDNLRAAVKHADWYDPEVHPQIQSFCEHYGTVILPTKPYTPRHKGKIERGIGYVKDNGLKGRTFNSLQEQNQYLLDWEARIADTRIHGTTRKEVGKLFREEEQSQLIRLPAGRFPCFHEAKRRVHRDGYIEVQKAYYAVDPEYTGREVWARWDGHLVRIFNGRMEQIAVHAQGEPGRFHTRPEFIHSQKRTRVEKGTVWLLKRASLIGDHAGRWGQAMLQTRGVEGVRVLVGLLSLAKRYDENRINRACEIALSHQAFRLRTIRALIKRDGPKQEVLEFIDEHPIIRSMSAYEAIVRASLW